MNLPRWQHHTPSTDFIESSRKVCESITTTIPCIYCSFIHIKQTNVARKYMSGFACLNISSLINIATIFPVLSFKYLLVFSELLNHVRMLRNRFSFPPDHIHIYSSNGITHRFSAVRTQSFFSKNRSVTRTTPPRILSPASHIIESHNSTITRS